MKIKIQFLAIMAILTIASCSKSNSESDSEDNLFNGTEWSLIEYDYYEDCIGYNTISFTASKVTIVYNEFDTEKGEWSKEESMTISEKYQHDGNSFSASITVDGYNVKLSGHLLNNTLYAILSTENGDKSEATFKIKANNDSNNLSGTVWTTQEKDSYYNISIQYYIFFFDDGKLLFLDYTDGEKVDIEEGFYKLTDNDVIISLDNWKEGPDYSWLDFKGVYGNNFINLKDEHEKYWQSDNVSLTFSQVM